MKQVYQPPLERFDLRSEGNETSGGGQTCAKFIFKHRCDADGDWSPPRMLQKNSQRAAMDLLSLDVEQFEARAFSQRNPKMSCLILENHPVFGGEAKPNEAKPGQGKPAARPIRAAAKPEEKRDSGEAAKQEPHPAPAAVTACR